jgi:pyridoxine/pyridoxamine 5'-phosphate oxidase
MQNPYSEPMTTAEALEEILNELRLRYDGAEDSPTRWMGYFIQIAADALESKGEDEE